MNKNKRNNFIVGSFTLTGLVIGAVLLRMLLPLLPSSPACFIITVAATMIIGGLLGLLFGVLVILMLLFLKL
jgi:hypothetical protein